MADRHDRAGAERQGRGPGSADSSSKEDRSSDRLGPSGVVQRLWEGGGGPGIRVLGALLGPAELGFRAAVRVRNAAYRVGLADTDAPPVPAISVGNITVGGTGKTPLVRWLVRRLVERGWVPGILHGGYADDEPLLHRRWFPDLPVVADRDRLRGAGEAMRRGADVLVLDDAFQHRRFGRDLDLVLVSAETWSRTARLLPRGPYRESPRALRRADLVVITRRTADGRAAARVEVEAARVSGCPTARVHLRPGAWLDARFRPRPGPPAGPALAVAAVGRPDDFFDQAESVGVQLGDAIAFPDHHPYTPAEAAVLQEEAAGRPIVTTAKDAVKLGELLRGADLWILEQDVVFESGRERVTRAIDEVVT